MPPMLGAGKADGIVKRSRIIVGYRDAQIISERRV